MERVEGHLNWIRELIPESAKTDEELKSHCVKLLEDGKREDAKGAIWNDWSTVSAEKLNTAVMSLVTGNAKKAGLLLMELDELFNGDLMKGVRKMQLEMILYCRDVLRWQIAGGVDANEEMRLYQMWDYLEDYGEKEVEAMVCYLKGSLGYKLKVMDFVVKNYYLEACDLDPKCLAWYYHSYRIIRKIRLAKGGFNKGPSPLEKWLAKTPNRLCDGKNAIVAANYSLMIKETIKKQNCQFWRDLYSAFVTVLENAVTFAEGDYLMKIRIHLAEFLYFGEGTLDERMRGREMFNELERDYPKSWIVLHKVGSVYWMERKFDRARQCFKRALDLEPTAVSCIMDYVKLLKVRNDQAEIIRVLERALSQEHVTSGKDSEKLQKELELAMSRRCSWTLEA